jgi:hypothetical protein
MSKNKEKEWQYSDNPEPQMITYEKDITDHFYQEKTLRELCNEFGPDSIIRLTSSGYDNPEAYIVVTQLEEPHQVSHRLSRAACEREEYLRKMKKEQEMRLAAINKKAEQIEKLKKEIESLRKDNG